MSNVRQLVQSVYAAFAEKRFEDLVRVFTDDSEVTYFGPTDLVPFLGTYRGASGVRQLFSKIDEYMEAKLAPQDIVADGDKVVVRLRGEGKAKPTGKHFEVETIHFWTVRNEQVASLRIYNDTASLARALGSVS